MSNADIKDKVEGAASIATGAAAGAATASAVGGMGLVGGFGGVAIGATPVIAAGAVAGSAVYGAKKALEERDATALGAVAGGAALGTGAASVIGGMGLAVGGTAVAVGAAPVVAAGAVLGLAAYGLGRLVGAARNARSWEVKSVPDELLINSNSVQSSPNYGKLLNWFEDGIWQYGIGINDKYVYDLGQFKLIHKPDAKNVINIDHLYFCPTKVILRLKYAIKAFANWTYTPNFNHEHLARLIATDDAISYQTDFNGHNETAMQASEIFRDYLQRVNPDLNIR